MTTMMSSLANRFAGLARGLRLRGAGLLPQLGRCSAVLATLAWFAAVPAGADEPPSQAAGDRGASGPSESQDTNPYDRYYRAGRMIFDGAFVRVPAIGSLVIGSAMFAVSSPVAAVAGTLEEAEQVFVLTPYRFAIARPLGNFKD